jgi:UDP-N-acetylmuramoyl-tripeptide--D-alanyl-D-alanine ligase
VCSSDLLEPDGTAIIPFDSPYRDLLMEKAKENDVHIMTFGFGEGADTRASEAVPSATGGTLVAAHIGEAILCFTVAAPGDHNVSNALAILATVETLGADLAAAGLALAEMPGLPGRGARKQIPAGSGKALLIDESYNANPLSMSATLRQLGHEKAARRIAVLGAMRELGSKSASLHEALAEPVEHAHVDFAILVGEEMAPLAHRLEGKLAFAHVADANEATRVLRGKLQPEDAVLVKGSNGVGLSRLVADLSGGEI